MSHNLNKPANPSVLPLTYSLVPSHPTPLISSHLLSSLPISSHLFSHTCGFFNLISVLISLLVGYSQHLHYAVHQSMNRLK